MKKERKREGGKKKGRKEIETGHFRGIRWKERLNKERMRGRKEGRKETVLGVFEGRKKGRKEGRKESMSCFSLKVSLITLVLYPRSLILPPHYYLILPSHTPPS